MCDHIYENNEDLKIIEEKKQREKVPLMWINDKRHDKSSSNYNDDVRKGKKTLKKKSMKIHMLDKKKICTQ
jgi:hypothetical protein